jgi:hypothetical protein
MSAEPPELTRTELRRVADEFKSARDAAERDTLRAIEDRNAALEALRMTEHHLREEQRLREQAEAARRQAEMDLADAVAWIRVVGDECVLAGMPGGDRTVILANIRRVLAYGALVDEMEAERPADTTEAQRAREPVAWMWHYADGRALPALARHDPADPLQPRVAVTACRPLVYGDDNDDRPGGGTPERNPYCDYPGRGM